LSSDGAVGRHTDAAALSREHAAAVWDQVSSGETSVHVRLTSDGGKTWDAPRRLSKAGHSSMHPRLVAGEGNFLVFYTETLADNTQFLRLDLVRSGSATP
ncbi:MAG: hypothetical protein H7X97_11040, partial [Opitutaceae bacterium]|nr:hypothetical protein [Verrucomicrobiales bacterium]